MARERGAVFDLESIVPTGRPLFPGDKISHEPLPLAFRILFTEYHESNEQRNEKSVTVRIVDGRLPSWLATRPRRGKSTVDIALGQFQIVGGDGVRAP